MRNPTYKCLAILLVLCVTAAGSNAYAEDNRPKPDYVVYAAFMGLFTAYLEWPDSNKVSICVYGDSEIASDPDIANKMYAKAPKPGMTLSLHSVKDWHIAAKNCQILFIAASEEKKIPDIIAGLKSVPVLTVSEATGFADEGGMIELFAEPKLGDDGKVLLNEDGSEKKSVRYIIRGSAIKAAGINITNPEILAKAKDRK
jgi:hypothetical protein